MCNVALILLKIALYILGIGTAIVPVSPILTPSELNRILNLSKPDTIFTLKGDGKDNVYNMGNELEFHFVNMNRHRLL